ncbi:cobalt-precorrin-7 (C(5))-methyltransferase [Clostridioides mangenotii]|uniref:cobalt-precorrin-7 (C(5))-methyltransferase n=1 Tax=Metaclostridioides mangenotii TaxID=1540 RepID=UPI001C11513C|nr:cobalt-precorrin-7 (C(5))-methyltransferase [Clostridioides mangenotii]MBU5308613.1 cobalt-precorrin-7 (C(5))-methyltransferase [Clostridioides mangenotii]MCR1954974.1 cobalt-precorrin-7 (C(5))-methyltransferase [Clostridioides mangenotii]
MINIIGLGPGKFDYITKIGENLIKKSDIVIGGKRNIESLKNFDGDKIEITNNLKEIVEYININKDKEISIIASGDPSIYGIARYIVKNVEYENISDDINVISGISSMQYIFSKIYVDMNDLYITSSHGKEPDFDYILSHKKVCMVTDKKIGPREISKEILNRGLKKTIVVGENLSYENEQITVGYPMEILKKENYDMNVVVILDE